MCDNSDCVISISNVNDGNCDCEECDDEDEWDCESCLFGCPTVCDDYVICHWAYYLLPYVGCNELFDTSSDSGCSVLSYFINDGYCDCDGCEDEELWTCDSCAGGCPSACGDSSYCGTNVTGYDLNEMLKGFKVCGASNYDGYEGQEYCIELITDGGSETSTVNVSNVNTNTNNNNNSSGSNTGNISYVFDPTFDTGCLLYYEFNTSIESLDIFVWCIELETDDDLISQGSIYTISVGVFNYLQSMATNIYVRPAKYQSWAFDFGDFVTRTRERGSTFYSTYIYFWGYDGIEHAYHNAINLINTNAFYDETHFDITLGM